MRESFSGLAPECALSGRMTDQFSTIGFSKKLANLKAAVAMHMAYYNFCWRPREKGKSGRKRLTPAMAAGVTNTLWSLEDLYERVTP